MRARIGNETKKEQNCPDFHVLVAALPYHEMDKSEITLISIHDTFAVNVLSRALVVAIQRQLPHKSSVNLLFPALTQNRI